LFELYRESAGSPGVSVAGETLDALTSRSHRWFQEQHLARL